MKLLDTAGGNTKIKKSGKNKKVRIASLSLYPDDEICPARNLAGCAEACLVGSGRGVMSNVINGRKNKTEWYHSDRPAFIAQLKKELLNFAKLCKREKVQGYVRLNTISDIPFELRSNGQIPQSFPELNFYDYTKRAFRLNRIPANYKLMFSYSAKKEYKSQVMAALKTPVPISAVFYGEMPTTFLGRPVINGDLSDLINVEKTGYIIGLKYKPNRINQINPLHSPFIICTDRPGTQRKNPQESIAA
mgnify:CR=1 FL=1